MCRRVSGLANVFNIYGNQNAYFYNDITAVGSITAASATFSGSLTASVVTSKCTADPLSGEREGLRVADAAGSVIFRTDHKSHGATYSGNYVRFYCRKASGALVNVFDINGSKHAAFHGNVSAVSYTTTSDERVKEDVQDVDLSPVFDAVSCKSYRRTDKPELGRRVGFLSQDVQAACASSGLPDTFTTPMDDTGLLGLDYSRLVTVLWSKCKQLESRLRAIDA